ncbi:hypothetical protein [Halocola ammonii]
MKNVLKFSMAAFAIALSVAFTTTSNDGLEITYGVSEDDPSQIELQLNSNFEFTYQDFSDPNQKIMTAGTYTLDKNTVVLSAKSDVIKFHDKWKLSDDMKTAKSRKGMTFYTLMKVE